ncbi:MAG: xanthine dehydrogenase small subunit [Pseudomonadota bacterium]
MEIVFLLNGAEVRLSVAARPDLATTTLLDWLRTERGLRGTKEGCNEGDCGACSVMVTGSEDHPKALNACILFMPQLHGKAVRTVEGIAAPDGTLHPVQDAMISEHGAQCGFCTPGFVVTMATAHACGRTDHADQLAGNLCRCTGYAPIVRAARAAEAAPVPPWVRDTPPEVSSVPAATDGESCVAPESADALAEWYAAHPDATLVAGATDVGLWVTKGMRELRQTAFLHRCRDLQCIEYREDGSLRIGAAVTLSEMQAPIARRFPSFGELIRRYGSVQVRNAATIGGNIANGSPIGDGAPALIALGARLHLRHGSIRRDIPLEDFFLEYGRQDRAPGEFVEAVEIPAQADDLRCYKLSKRFDQDISAVCGCFVIRVSASQVTEARIAFGGLAGIPKRAQHVEKALVGESWTGQTIERAKTAIAQDFAPIDDMRASADYRALAASHMLQRFFVEKSGARTNVLEVSL